MPKDFVQKASSSYIMNYTGSNVVIKKKKREKNIVYLNSKSDASYSDHTTPHINDLIRLFSHAMNFFEWTYTHDEFMIQWAQTWVEKTPIDLKWCQTVSCNFVSFRVIFKDLKSFYSMKIFLMNLLVQSRVT